MVQSPSLSFRVFRADIGCLKILDFYSKAQHKADWQILASFFPNLSIISLLLQHS